MPEMTDLARVYREAKYQAKNFEQYTLALPNAAGRTVEFPIANGSRNACAIEVSIASVLTATAAQAAVANSKASDVISLEEVLDPSGAVYHEYPNYGVAATDATKPLNRLAQFFGDDVSALVTDTAAAAFGGAGSVTLTWDVVRPLTVPAGQNYRFRWTVAPVTNLFAANVSYTSITATVTLYLTDASVPQWYARAKAIPLSAVGGANPLAQFFKDGETILGFYLLLVTTAEADLTLLRLAKGGSNYLNTNYTVLGTNTNNRYTFGARLTGEVLVFHDSLQWDSKTILEATIAATGAAGTFRLMTFHPYGSAAPSPDARNANAGFQKETPTVTSGTQAAVIPATGAGAQAAIAQSPSAVPTLQAGPGLFNRLRTSK